MDCDSPAKVHSMTADLELMLGTTYLIWQKLIAELTEAFPTLRQQWKPSKIPFGRICLLKLRDRTLLYLILEPCATSIGG